MNNTKKEDMKREIETLIAQAAAAEKSEDAMRFSQAACNCANTLACLAGIEYERLRLNK